MTTNQKIAKKFRELADLFESLDDNSSGSPAEVTYEAPWAIDEWRYNTPSTAIPLPSYTHWNDL